MDAMEIIETYWNVNFLTVNLLNLKDAEIIETYWNVNYGGLQKTQLPPQK